LYVNAIPIQNRVFRGISDDLLIAPANKMPKLDNPSGVSVGSIIDVEQSLNENIKTALDAPPVYKVFYF
jgi:hypothetical protein